MEPGFPEGEAVFHPTTLTLSMSGLFFVTFMQGHRPEYKKQKNIMYRNNQNQDVIRLLLLLRTVENEYPFRMMSCRRVNFVNLVYKYVFWRPPRA